MEEPGRREEEDDYRESDDEDFNPEAANDNDVSDSESDAETKGDEPLDASVDAKYKALEGTGLIKTRAQRQAEEEQEKEYQRSQLKPTVDVNSLWQSMNDSAPKAKPNGDEKPAPPTAVSIKEEYITINRTYKFAGKVTTEEKRVLASSAEGKAYLAEQGASSTPTTAPSADQPKRKVVKKRKSSLLDELEAGKAKKVNTLEKSRLDWLGFVDSEGIKDDLTRHNKGGYLQKQDFLSRVEHKIDQDIKSALKKKQ